MKKLIYISVIIFLYFNLIGCGTKSNSEAKEIEPFENVVYGVINVQEDTLNLLSLGKSQIIIFSMTNSCHDCYIHISDAIISIKKQINKKIIVSGLIRSNNDIVSRRSDINYFKKLIDVDTFLFDIHQEKNNEDISNGYKDGIFSKYKIVNVPSVLIINEGKFYFFSNAELFKRNSNIENILLSAFK